MTSAMVRGGSLLGDSARLPSECCLLPGSVIRRLDGLVTRGPWDLEIAWAMAAHGYDEVKWAEGQGVLAELVSDEVPARATLAAAAAWYEEAADAARQALAARPQLLAKLGLIQD